MNLTKSKIKDFLMEKGTKGVHNRTLAKRSVDKTFRDRFVATVFDPCKFLSSYHASEVPEYN